MLRPREFIGLTPGGQPATELADLSVLGLRLSTRATYLEIVIILTLTNGLAGHPTRGPSPTRKGGYLQAKGIGHLIIYCLDSKGAGNQTKC